MNTRAVSRRQVLQRSAALAGLAFVRFSWPAQAFPERPGEEVIPWADQPAPNPVPDVAGTLLKWEELDSWITPNEKFFTIKHFGQPVIDDQAWRLEVGGLVGRPLSLSLDELKARPRQEVTFTVECSGNHGFPWNGGLVGNTTWAGTPLAPLLAEAGIADRGIEVVFFGRDAGEKEVRQIKMQQHFARSLSLADATGPDTLLCYEMNGEPLPAAHGAPVRLIVPGWYGVANVKWLDRIEVLDTRFMGHFMATDYVTIREEQRGGEAVWTLTSVGRARLKSAPAKVARLGGQYRIVGAAWGAPIAGVEVQVDGGDWMPATLDEGAGAPYAWAIWSLDWAAPSMGEHTVTTRAVDTAGNIQVAPDDPRIANKRTYWESYGQVTRRVILT